MQYGRVGIFQGGAVTKSTTAPKLLIEPVIIQDANGNLLAFGQGGRAVNVLFGQASYSFTAIRPNGLDSPIYTLKVPTVTGETVGSAVIVCDPNEEDIRVKSSAETGDMVMTTVQWDADTVDLATLTLITTDRQVSRVVETTDPLNPSQLYNAGMAFADMSFNEPLVAFSVMANVLQAKMLRSAGTSFDVSLLLPSHLSTSGADGAEDNLTVAPFFVYVRRSDLYRTLNTQIAQTLTLALPDGAEEATAVEHYQGQRVYLTIDVEPEILVASTTDTIASNVIAQTGQFVGVTTVDKVVIDGVSYTLSMVSDNSLTLVDGPDNGSVTYTVVRPNNLGTMDLKATAAAEWQLLVAYTDVPADATALEDCTFIVVTTDQESNSQALSDVEVKRLTYPGGFINPLEIMTTGLEANQVRLLKNIGYLYGLQSNLSETDLTLPTAPTSGTRLDAVLFEVWRESVTSIPTAGNYYNELPESGAILEIKTNLRTITGITAPTRAAAFIDSDTLSVKGPDTESPYVYNASLGLWEADYDDAYDGKSYALPILFVTRFNSLAWSKSNMAGGGIVNTGGDEEPVWESTRPDGKRFDILSPDEIEIVAPVLPLKGLDTNRLILSTIRQILNGGLNTHMEQAIKGNYYSRKPLQIDTIRATDDGSGGTTKIATPDGVRRQWSARPTPQAVGSRFTGNTDVPSNGRIGYDKDASDGPELTIYASDGATLALDGDNRPLDVEVIDVATGLSAAFKDDMNWTVQSDSGQTVATITLDSAVGGYATKQFAVSFKLILPADGYLSRSPIAALESVTGVSNEVVIMADNTAGTVETVGDAGTTIVTPYLDSTRAKGDALAYRLTATTAPGSGASIEVNLSYLGRTVLGAIQVINTSTGLPYGILTEKRTGSKVQIYLTSNPGSPTGVTVTLALAGKLVTYDPRNNAVAESAQSSLLSVSTGNGTATNYLLLDNDEVLLGVMGILLNTTTPTLYSSVYVGDRSFPAYITGWETNLVRLKLEISAALYATLTGDEQSHWTLSDSKYVLNDGGAVVVKIPLLRSWTLGETDSCDLRYQYAASPFVAMTEGVTPTVVEMGYYFAGNDSIAQDGTSPYSPIAEKLPVVRGGRYGVDADTVDFLLNPVALSRFDSLIPFPDEVIDLAAGTIEIGAGAEESGAGYVGWFALVRIDRALHLFTYVTDDGPLVVYRPDRAFLTTPAIPYVE